MIMKRIIPIPSSLPDPKCFGESNINSGYDESHMLAQWCGLGLQLQIKCKMIDPEILKNYGAKEIQLRKDDVVFREEEEALNYFQIIKGSIKMSTSSPEGKEFIQGVFKGNDSFGEPPLFCNFPYPSTASAIEPTTIIKLLKENFLQLLRENFEIHLQMDQVLCQRLRYKSMVLSEISSYDPEHRIISLLKYFKTDADSQMKREKKPMRTDFSYTVPFTRQQIADMSGLRVETVIRTVKKMETDGKVKIIGRKISF